MMTAHEGEGEVPMTVSAAEFKGAMSRVAATVTIVTAPGDEGPVGLTVSAFMSVSSDPAIVLVCIDKSTASLAAMLDADGFTVNVMAEGTEEEAMRFATHGADKFGGSEWSVPAIPGAGPVLSSALESFECTTLERTEMGDHWVIYGEVNAIATDDPDTAPLVWLGRGFVKVR